MVTAGLAVSPMGSFVGKGAAAGAIDASWSESRWFGFLIVHHPIVQSSDSFARWRTRSFAGQWQPFACFPALVDRVLRSLQNVLCVVMNRRAQELQQPEVGPVRLAATIGYSLWQQMPV